MTNNVKARVCLWCHEKLRAHTMNQKVYAKLHPACKEELKKMRILLGKPEFIKVIEKSGIDFFDVYSNYKDFIK